ncbi:MAG: ATP-dependent sacrificial sulfur transferase LarE [Planctomycetes bacterium]|nr:ATP-dependent sacrificial sulfur transferase LarE [Planctomycetota bacterium]
MGEGTLHNKLDEMKRLIGEMERVAVAFSGGTDSAFVLRVARDVLGAENVLAVTGRSDSLASRELDGATRLAHDLGVEHVVLDTDEFQNPDYLANPHNRCYFCKVTLYSEIERFIRQRGITQIASGTNADDLSDWRPGLQAAKEHSVRSPAAEAGLTKQEIRLLSRELGLPTFDKPASPCLSSRVPYGEEITPQKLRMIEAAERCLQDHGFRECRVRHHGDMARIEVPVVEIPRLIEPTVSREIDARLREIGYAHVTVDLRGFRSGSLNEVIAFGRRQASVQD